MLTLTVGLRAGADEPWQWCEQAESCWRRGRDRIRPLAHPALEARAVTGGTTTLMVVRERAAGRASLLRSTAPVRVDGAVYARAVEECRDSPLQSVWVEAGPDGVRLSTGLGGVCPLYLAHGQGTLSGSWQLMDLSAQMTPDQLDEKEVMRLLTGQPRYGHDTLVTGIKRLSERSSAYADADGLRLVYPAAAEHAVPSELAEGTDGPALVGAFEVLVDHIGARRPLSPAQTAAQLSGGKDSTNLAISLALAHPGRITPCALLIGGQGPGRKRDAAWSSITPASPRMSRCWPPSIRRSPRAGCAAPARRPSARWTSRTWRPPTRSPRR